MRKLATALGLAALLGLGACTDSFGRPDPVGTALLGAGVGAAAGLAIGSASQPRHHHHYHAPRRGHWGHFGPPRHHHHFHHHPRRYYRW